MTRRNVAVKLPYMVMREKSEKLTVMMDPVEMRRLRAASTIANVSLSELVRRLIAGHAVKLEAAGYHLPADTRKIARGLDVP